MTKDIFSQKFLESVLYTHRPVFSRRKVKVALRQLLEWINTVNLNCGRIDERVRAAKLKHENYYRFPHVF